MILLRDGMHVLRLEQCGLGAHERFTFFDQVHTTGMDIPQPLAACAMLTLGKDLTWRDYAQGAFRMRGIKGGSKDEGQTCCSCAAGAEADRRRVAAAGGAGGEGDTRRLRAVAAWLHVNSM